MGHFDFTERGVTQGEAVPPGQDLGGVNNSCCFHHNVPNHVQLQNATAPKHVVPTAEPEVDEDAPGVGTPLMEHPGKSNVATGVNSSGSLRRRANVAPVQIQGQVYHYCNGPGITVL